MNKLFCSVLLFILSFTTCFAQELLKDDFAVQTVSAEKLVKPVANLDYNYQDTDVVKIPLFIVHPIKSEKDLYEGQRIKFRVAQKVYYNKKVVARNGQILTARVETIIKNGMNGIPASIILGDFDLPPLKKSRLSASYEHFGLDLSMLVFPLKWALTPLPPTGSLTNFIKGGHANIRGYETVAIYYHPNWN